MSYFQFELPYEVGLYDIIFSLKFSRGLVLVDQSFLGFLELPDYRELTLRRR